MDSLYAGLYYVHLLLRIYCSDMEVVEGDYDSLIASFKNTVIYAIFAKLFLVL